MNVPPPAPAKIVIFGPYKTGTTGLFYKIANSLPEAPRVFFEKPAYVPEAGDGQRWVLAKTILWYDDGPPPVRYDTFMGFDKKIYLVRDPRDWIVSGTLFFIQQEPSLYDSDANMAEILNLLRRKVRRPLSLPLNALLERIMGLSEAHDFDAIVEWIRKQYAWLPSFEAGLEGYCRLRYEDFVDGRLTRLEQYLGFPLAGDARVARAHDHVPRTKGYGNWRDWFVAEDIDFFQPLFQDYMTRYGYGDDWRLSRRPEILPAHSTDYVIRTVNKRRRVALDPHHGLRPSFWQRWLAKRR